MVAAAAISREFCTAFGIAVFRQSLLAEALSNSEPVMMPGEVFNRGVAVFQSLGVVSGQAAPVVIQD